MSSSPPVFAVFALLLPWAPAWSQPLEDPSTHAVLSAPVLGMVFDAAVHGLRPVVGTPGAALVAGPLRLDFEIDQAVVSPRQDYALALAGDSGELRLITWRRGVLATRSLDTGDTPPDRLFVSPSGSAVALYRLGARRLEILTGLPDAPAPARILDLSGLDGDPAHIALSDDGALVLAATATSTQLFSPEPIPLPLGAVRAMAFRPGGHDAVLAADGQVAMARDLGGEPQYQVLAADADAPAAPLAVEFSSDAARAFVASPSGDIVALDLAGGAPARLSCGCTPAGLYRMNGASLFRISQPSDELPLWLLDGSTAPPRLLFVPPDRAEADPGRPVE